MQVLLQAGASVQIGCNGSPALHLAVCAALVAADEKLPALERIVQLLLQHQASPYARCMAGRAVTWLGTRARGGVCGGRGGRGADVAS